MEQLFVIFSFEIIHTQFSKDSRSEWAIAPIAVTRLISGGATAIRETYMYIYIHIFQRLAHRSGRVYPVTPRKLRKHLIHLQYKENLRKNSAF